MFFLKRKLIKDNIKFMAELLYEDVSPEKWDQENLTKDNLNFSIESVLFVDEYADRLIHTEFGQQLLKEHPNNLPKRIGAYLGEVIKNHINAQYNWFTFKSIKENTNHLNNFMMSVESECVLYSKKLDKVMCPIYEARQYLNGESTYKTLSNYVDNVIQEHNNMGL